MRDALKRHWPEYLIEAVCLGIFMMLICLSVLALEHPASPLHSAIASPLQRRFLVGAGVGLSITALIYSPWGKRSGAHLNPALTLTFWRLGKVSAWDALFYIIAQFMGGIAGVWLLALLMRAYLAAPEINYVATVPPAHQLVPAFAAEMLMSFLLMGVILVVSNTPHLARLTGICVGLLVATYIGVEAPLSGMSLNPARTLGSALPAQVWTAWWIYFTAPVLGMLLAAQIYQFFAQRGIRYQVFCAKLHHHHGAPCIFCEHHHSGEAAS